MEHAKINHYGDIEMVFEKFYLRTCGMTAATIEIVNYNDCQEITIVSTCRGEELLNVSHSSTKHLAYIFKKYFENN